MDNSRFRVGDRVVCTEEDMYSITDAGVPCVVTYVPTEEETQYFITVKVEDPEDDDNNEYHTVEARFFEHLGPNRLKRTKKNINLAKQAIDDVLI